MFNKMVLLISFASFAIASAYAASPEQTRLMSLDQNSLQVIIENANKGDANAQYLLGAIYHFGQGVQQDYNEAFKWYRKGAESGEARSQHWLGFMYDNGEGVIRDYNEAFWWYKKAAEQGLPEAQFSLGLMYYLGNVVPKDLI